MVATPVETDPGSDDDPRIARSRARLLAAATELLVESGPAAVTVDAIAERSGVAKSTLYRHWSSRAELMLDVMRHNVPVVPPPDLSGGFESALRSLLRGVAAGLASHDWARILPALIALKHDDDEIGELVEADLDARVAELTQVLELGVAEGRPLARLEPRFVVNLLVGPLVFAAINDDTEHVVALADEIVDRFVRSCPPTPDQNGTP